MLSVKITNALCNLQCAYCYEHVYRERANQRPFDLEAIRKQIDREGMAPYLHGGEALLAPVDAIEVILAKAHEMVGHSSIQTNGTLITEEHIELFKKYNTHVGVSMDGPGEMSRYRIPVEKLPARGSAGDLIWQNVKKLRQEGIHVGMICVLTRANALPGQRDEFKRWMRELDTLGITGRLNPAEIDYPKMKKIALTPQELAEFYCDIAEFVLTDLGGNWLPFRDVVDSLLGLDQGTCVFSECDYYNAGSEKVILSDGTTASCMKTSKTGHIYPRFQNAGQQGFAKIRYDILPRIAQEFGGCQDCKYWRNCLGGCPAEGVNGDWRNRSRYCEAYKALYDKTSHLLKTMFPNIRLTTDRPPEAFPHPNTVEGMYPGAVHLLNNTRTSKGSSWRRDNVPEPGQYEPKAETRTKDHANRPHGDHGDYYVGEGGR